MAKGGKGRKGGGGGGGKTRKYSRDNNGRFASTGTGATARGGRLLTPKGNKRKTQTIEAGGAKAAGTIKGKVKRDPAAASKVAQRKAAAKPTAAKRSAQAESDRGSAADRKERAKLLSAMPKEGRRAVQTAKTASRQRQAKGQLGVGIEGRRGRNTDQSINSVNEGSTRLRFDAGKRKSDPTKLTEGLRASTARSMAGSANSLKARMKTTAASKRTKAFGGTTTRRQLPGVKGTIKKQTKPPAAKPPAAKLPRAQRLERATATANRIAKDRSAKSDAATAALMARKGISQRASSKGKYAAFQKEDAAGKTSATAMRKWQGAEKRAENLRKAKGSETTAAKPPAAKPTAKALGGRLDPAKKAFRAADKKFLSTIQKEGFISKAAQNTRRDAKADAYRSGVKTPIAKGAKVNNTISKTKEKRDLGAKQRLFKQRITRAYDLPQNKTGAKGKRTAQIRAKAIATLQGAKRPDISDTTVGGLRRSRTSTGYKAPSSRLPAPSRAARVQGRARALAQTQRFNKAGNRIGNPKKLDSKRIIGARAVDFGNRPKAFLRRELVQNVNSRGVKGTAGFVSNPRSLTQTPKRIKPQAAKATSAKGARLGGPRSTTKAAAPKNTTSNRTGQSKTLNRFNSRPVGTMVVGKGINLVPSTKRVPLNIQVKLNDQAFARMATKAARARAAAPAKAKAQRSQLNREARALANQKRTAQAVVAKGGKRPSPTRKQKKSLAIADAARTFYSAKRVNSLPTFKVNTSKPGFRKPRPMR